MAFSHERELPMREGMKFMRNQNYINVTNGKMLTSQERRNLITSIIPKYTHKELYDLKLDKYGMSICLGSILSSNRRHLSSSEAKRIQYIP